jgi:hypothetical protein
MWGNLRIWRARQTARNHQGNQTGGAVISATEVEVGEEEVDDYDIAEGVVEVEDVLSVGVFLVFIEERNARQKVRLPVIKNEARTAKWQDRSRSRPRSILGCKKSSEFVDVVQSRSTEER